ncbi:MAG: aldo/keto reductase [Muribaculaceae bacterium]
MEKKDNNNISRRRFLKHLGIGALAGVATACGSNVVSETDKKKAGDGKMTYRVNHNTGDSVSVLGYGCMRLPTKSDPKTDADPEIDQEAVNAQVDYALEHGVNYFDTSPAYCKGRSEHVMGIALSRHPRDSYFIATKLSNFAPSTWPREESIAMFENSLKELQTDYIDYLLLHAVGQGSFEALNGRYIDNGILDYLKEKKEAGVIRNLGFSYHGDVAVFDHLLEMMDRGEVHWDFVQIQLNYVDWNNAKKVNDSNTDASYLYAELERRNIPVVIMEPLLGGRLASVSAPIAAKMKQRRPDDSIASWAFRYAGSHPGALTVLSGMTYLDHLKENVATYSPLDPVTDEENEFLEVVAQEILQNDTVPCTDCKYCMPCPYGVNIPAIFAHYNKCVNDDNVARDTRDPHYDKARRAFLVGYDRTVPKLRQASRCIACGNCLSECPQSIDIPGRLREIDQYVDRLKSGKA